MGRSHPPVSSSVSRRERRSVLAFRLRLLAVAWLPAAISLTALSVFVIGTRLEHRALAEDRHVTRLVTSLANETTRRSLDPYALRIIASALVRHHDVRAVSLKTPGLTPLRLARPAKRLGWLSARLAPLIRLLVPLTAPTILETRIPRGGPTTLTLHLALHPLLRRDTRTVLHVLPLWALALALSFLLALRLIRTISRPLGRLTQAFDRLRTGDLTTRVREDEPGDFGRLAGHFNRMAEQIATQQGELESRIAQATEELRASLERLERKNQELLELRRIAETASQAKTEFLANMSHEIRTPMNAVLGYAELLAASGLDHDQSAYLHAIRSSGESLLRLIDEILDLARIETGHVHLEHEPCDPRAIAERVAAMLAPQAFQKGLEFITDFYATPSRAVLGDQEKIRQVFSNLVANAIKFTARGSVAVMLHQHEDGDRVAYEFIVEDSGAGIPPQARERIFEPFAQADGSISRSHGGAGLGLAIARRLAEAMGGSLGYSPRDGRGSRFRLHLVLPAREVAATTSARDPVLAGRRGLVLCADADRTRRIVSLLEAWGAGAEGVSGVALETFGRRNERTVGWDFVVIALGAAEAASDVPWRGRWRPSPSLPVLVLAATADRGRIRRFAREFGGPCLPTYAAQDEIRARLRLLLGPVAQGSLISDPAIRHLLTEELPRERAALSSPPDDPEALRELLHRLEGTARFCRFSDLTAAIVEARKALADGRGSSTALAPVLRALDTLIVGLGLGEPTPVPARLPSERLKGLVVLVADDNRLNRELIGLMLRHHGARVDAYADGHETLAHAGDGAWDLALIDVHMPDVDGLAVIRELHTRFPDRPSLALSADVLPETREAASAAGAVDYLLKPVSEERLLRALTRALELRALSTRSSLSAT